jgi:hypothetical protein
VWPKAGACAEAVSHLTPLSTAPGAAPERENRRSSLRTALITATAIPAKKYSSKQKSKASTDRRIRRGKR